MTDKETTPTLTQAELEELVRVIAAQPAYSIAYFIDELFRAINITSLRRTL